jgi:flagellar motor switch protein FliM
LKIRLEVSIPGAIDTEAIQSLRVGDILESARKAGEPALLYIDGRPEFEGDIVIEKVEEKSPCVILSLSVDITML